MKSLKLKRKNLNKSLLYVSYILVSSIAITGCFDKTPNDLSDIDPIAKTKEVSKQVSDKYGDDIKSTVNNTVNSVKNIQPKTVEEAITHQQQNLNPNPSKFELINLYDTYVVDGDTVHGYDINRNKIKVRMLGIDAPESSQPMGKDSKASLEQCVSHSDDITLLVDNKNKTDRYGRHLAIVNSGIIDCNLYQVEQGMAYFYRDYADGLPNSKQPEFDTAESRAKQNKVGVWSQNLERPWEYRKSKRS